MYGYPYTTTKRRILCEILTKLFDTKHNIDPEFDNWQLVLKYLENKRRTEIPLNSSAEVISQSDIILKELYSNK